MKIRVSFVSRMEYTGEIDLDDCEQEDRDAWNQAATNREQQDVAQKLIELVGSNSPEFEPAFEEIDVWSVKEIE